MICGLQIGAFVYGIITLITGKFSLSKGKVILGARARIIGAVLLSWLPLAFAFGLVLGFIFAINNPGIVQKDLIVELQKYWWVELAIGAFLFMVVAGLVTTAPTPRNDWKSQEIQPSPHPRGDSNNPYEPPSSDGY